MFEEEKNIKNENNSKNENATTFQPIEGQPSGLEKATKKTKKKIIIWLLLAILSILAILLIVGIVWFNIQLKPYSSGISEAKTVKIVAGSTSSQIGKELEKQSIIKNALAFDIYNRLNNKNNLLKAGTYRLSSSESTPQIIKHLTESSSLDTFNITFYNGATLVDKTDRKNKYDVTTVLKKVGYTEKEISQALTAEYNGLLFAGKPSTADIEGYIYGETYEFNAGVSVRDILQKTFDEFYKIVDKNKLIEGFAKHDLNLYQGITLASIIQRESSNPEDQKKVAQVFLSRLKIGMSLGSDVTYQYIADKTGVPRDPNLDSPYNTRKYAGLPPGPISSPGLTALLAVANPDNTDYLFFVAGDDGITRFARTEAEHNTNVANYCKILCSTF